MSKRNWMVTACAIGLLAGTARGDLRTFTIDPVNSELNLTAWAFLSSAGGAPLVMAEQAPGSLATSVSGTIDAEFVGDTIAFTGGNIELADNGSWLPGPDVGNYGFGFDTGNPLIGAAVGAMRDASFEMNSSPTFLSLNGSGFDFDLDGAQLTGASGRVDFDGSPPGSILGALSGESQTIVGETSTLPASPPSSAQYEISGNTEYLILPLAALFEEFVPSAEISWELQGTVIASRTIPEPGSALVVLIGTSLLMRRRLGVRCLD